MKSSHGGFTLIELMITVAIVAILAGIAYPSYRESVGRSARAELKAALLENAQFLERNFTVANKYNQDSAGNALTLPATQSPKDGAAKYTIAANSTTATDYTLTATRAGSMASDKCGDFTLTNTGVKGLANATAPLAECWGR